MKPQEKAKPAATKSSNMKPTDKCELIERFVNAILEEDSHFFDQYNQWRDLGFIIANETQMSDQGLDLFIQLSANFQSDSGKKQDPEQCADQYKKAKLDAEKQLKMGTLRKWLRDKNPEHELLSEGRIIVTLDDLEKGERHIAELISPALQSTYKYWENQKGHGWFILNDSTNVWEETAKPDKFRIVKLLQECIEEEKNRLWKQWKAEEDADKKKEIGMKEKAIKKHYEKVGKGNYVNTLVNDYLCQLLKDNTFVEKLDQTKGKFVFRDCILDLKTGETKPITPDDYITFVNDIDYLALPESTKEKRAKVRADFIKIFNNTEAHLEYGLSALGYSLTGDAGREKAFFCFRDKTETAAGNNGKSFMFKILAGLFPKLVEATPYKVFEENYNNSHKFIIGWKNKRIIYCDEGTNKKVKPELVKCVGAGEPIPFEILFGTRGELIPMFKLFLCSNVMFNVGKDNGAVFNRYKELTFRSHFDADRETDDAASLEFKADTRLDETLLANYRAELIHLFIEYAMKYYEKGLPRIPAEFLEATNDTKMGNNPFAVWFKKHYKASDAETAKVSLDFLVSNYVGEIDRKQMIKELKSIGIAYYKDEYYGFDKITKKDIKGGIKGYAERTDEDDD
jgi:phage/plasmid-associated DNA primase